MYGPVRYRGSAPTYTYTPRCQNRDSAKCPTRLMPSAPYIATRDPHKREAAVSGALGKGGLRFGPGRRRRD